MRTADYIITTHARRRMAQRNLSLSDVTLVLRWGRRMYRTGVKFFFLGKRDVPRGREREFEHLVGATIVAAQNCVVIAYRNHAALSRIKRKLKWRLPDRQADLSRLSGPISS